MKKLNKQKVFERAYRGLRAQGFQQSLAITACAYNGSNGKHCAIGWIFPIGKNEEGVSFPLLAVAKNLDADDVEFLAHLQSTHDLWARADALARELKIFAAERGLMIPPVDGKDPVLVTD